MWTKEYRPEQISDIVGNEKNIKNIKEWAENWDIKSDSLLIYGPPGTGKTSTAYAVANEKNWEIIEMNASDKRTGSIVDKIAGEASKSKSLTNRNKLIIIDEADNLHGNYDRGGKKSILNVIKESKNPIILIGNDFYEFSRSLRNKTKNIEFDPVNDREIAKLLRDICNNENIDYEVDALKRIADQSEGDIRAAINDLQKYANGRDKLRERDISDENSRNQKMNIFPYLDSIFKDQNPKTVRQDNQDVDMTPNELIRWLKQNISKEYKDIDYINGINSISRSEIWLGRVTKTQNYKFWKYSIDSMTAGLANSRENNKSGWTRWSPPRYRTRNEPTNDFLEKLSSEQDVSIQVSKNEIIPYLSEMISYCKPKNLAVQIANEYNANKKDISVITGSGKNTNKVDNIINESTENESKDDTVDTMMSELTNINGIGEKTAKNICKEYNSIDDVVNSDVSELSKVRNLSSTKAEKIINEYIDLKDDIDEEDNNTEEKEQKDDIDEENNDQSDIDDFI